MQELWTSALATLRARLSEENFRTWLEPVQLESLTGRTVTLRIPNRFYADWISSHYLDLILETLGSGGAPFDASKVEVEWVVDEQLQKVMDERAERVPFPVSRRYCRQKDKHQA